VIHVLEALLAITCAVANSYEENHFFAPLDGGSSQPAELNVDGPNLS